MKHKSFHEKELREYKIRRLDGVKFENQWYVKCNKCGKEFVEICTYFPKK
jgi:hypothetical protein